MRKMQKEICGEKIAMTHPHVTFKTDQCVLGKHDQCFHKKSKLPTKEELTAMGVEPYEEFLFCCCGCHREDLAETEKKPQ